MMRKHPFPGLFLLVSPIPFFELSVFFTWWERQNRAMFAVFFFLSVSGRSFHDALSPFIETKASGVHAREFSSQVLTFPLLRGLPVLTGLEPIFFPGPQR